MNDALIRLLLILIAIVTVLTGGAQMLSPDTVLSIIGADLAPPTAHLFRTVGMFMVITGAMFLQSLLSRSADPSIPLWIGIQKLAGAGLIALGVMHGLFAPLALGVTVFDALSGLLALLFLRRLSA